MSLWKRFVRIVFWFKVFLFRKSKPNWFKLSSKVETLVVLNLNERHFPLGDAVVATAWSTAEFVSNLSQDKGTKFYFIQGYENWDTTDEKIAATFKLPLKKIVVSSWLEEKLFSENEEAIACIPNGLDFKVFNIMKPIENRFPGRIGMCYSVYNWKGSKDGIEAFEIVRKRLPHLQAIFFSVCPRNPEIPSWIEYWRNPSPSHLLDIYNSCSIFINPSWSEGWGLPTAEAMACGCAVISVRNKGAEEFVIDQETGLLTKVRDPAELAEKIIKLIEDQPLRIKLAQAGANFIKRFDLKESAKRFEEAILSNLNYK
ncbi:MAG: glycosyltransferase family 4 protein [candidate division Zixibacteria bacterium]|nr:glycosyltransferase family 4 protein [candidate division Zixibacteria bacterium]